MFKKKIVCVIPVKTKSTRLKKKNFLNFYDTPLFLLTIKIAKASKCFDLIIVTSDNKRIKRLCEKNGAIFHYRTKYTDKHSAVSLATYNVINELRLYKNFDYATVKFIEIFEITISILYSAAFIITFKKCIDAMQD